MNNPWTELPNDKPYILASDREMIEQFNKIARTDHFIHHEMLPEPFMGNPDAPIVLLNGNPSGHSDNDLFWYQKPEFARLTKGNLVHAPSDHSFYLLNPKAEGSGGYSWWMKKLKPVISCSDQKTVANNIFCVEYFPYHSIRAANFQKYKRIPSQEYSFHLVEKAINRNAHIILMRWKNSWLGTFPQLNTYDNIYRLNTSRNVIISPGNCPGGFEKIVDVLKNAKANDN
ncbi:MAG: hypothetical protein HXX08_22095 [Chloroflexi bacterium]|uniref:Uncharacterized protein n=1 Tax=Candidatus Chlorohelix allophototropha TaxID=3003348 RepID=A0A8T7M8W8_9CHLR|nr:hypothetical protein [Chloroflexota bacterium]WJW68490.1 hypothetical protein OZ401_004103 [Chloroflexota bacterium L227-S17]